MSSRAPDRELTIEVTAEPAGWTFSAANAEAHQTPSDLGDDLLVLREALGFGVPVDGADDKAAAIVASLERLAAEVGDTLTALLPQEARDALDRLAAGAAVSGPVLVRLRVDGLDANRVLLLPWELLRSGGGFPLARGEIDLVREVVRPGLEQGLPEAPPPLTVVSHLAAPEGEDVPPLNLEEAAFRMAQALDHLRERTRFTELGTVGDLKAAVAAVKPTLLHFAGHGLPGKLLFEDDACAAEEVAVDELLNHLRLAAGGRLPLAVWLSCCYGAGPLGELAETLGERLAGAAAGRGASSETSREAGREWQAFTVESPSLCADLHHAGIPQVLGYFGPVPDALAVEVDRRLFEGLTGGGSGVEAVRQARLATRNPIATPEGKVRFPLAWALLALYHRGPDRPLAVPRGALPAAVEEALEPEVLQLEGVEVLRHGFIGRRRLLADLRKRRRQRERTLGLYGLGGLGKTATMTRLASILTGGGPGWHQRVLVVPAGERLRPESGEPDDPFLWLW
ncbi:MAG TPA: CHAT domain-containing protein, partial [Thermoanaerobaculia bacterium]|nr:CHAT domain-containing protein [Thermoanaerobaculia bacterium]